MKWKEKSSARARARTSTGPISDARLGLFWVESSGFNAMRSSRSISHPTAGRDKSEWDQKGKASDAHCQTLTRSPSFLWWSPSLWSSIIVATWIAERSNRASGYENTPFNSTPVRGDFRRGPLQHPDRLTDLLSSCALCQFFARLQQLHPGRVYFWSDRQKFAGDRRNRKAGGKIGDAEPGGEGLVCGATGKETVRDDLSKKPPHCARAPRVRNVTHRARAINGVILSIPPPPHRVMSKTSRSFFSEIKSSANPIARSILTDWLARVRFSWRLNREIAILLGEFCARSSRNFEERRLAHACGNFND